MRGSVISRTYGRQALAGDLLSFKLKNMPNNSFGEGLDSGKGFFFLFLGR